MAKEFLHGGGEMGDRIRAFDWPSTPLGPAANWPLPLRTAVALMLGARQPVYIAWGPALTSLYNDAYIPILGSKHPAALGQPYATLWAEIMEQFTPIITETMAGKAQYFEDMPVALEGREGRPMSWFTFSWTPLRDDAGEVAGFYCAASETTDRVYAARETAERLQLAIDASHLGTFVWYVDDDRTESDDRMLSLFGLTPGGTLNLAEALGKLIHPDDVDRYAQAVGRALEPGGSGTLREEIRVIHPDASLHWVAVTGRVSFEGDPPRAVRLIGTAADITERKRDEARARGLTRQASFLVSLGDALRPLEHPIAIQEAAAATLREQLAANRAVYFEVTSTDYVIERDAAHGVSSLRGRYPIEHYGAPLIAAIRTGQQVIVHDIPNDPQLSAGEKAEYAAIQIAAHIGVPLVKTGRLVAGLAVHSATPRRWTAEEVALVVEVAERTWSAVERAKAEAAVRTSEAKYRSLFESMDQGYCIIECLFDGDGRAFDYRFVEVNPAYQKQAGLTNVIGRTARELVPGLNAFWFETYGRIAMTGQAERFQSPAVAKDYSHVFDVFAFRVGAPEERRVAVLFTDVSEQVQARESLREADRRKDEFLATLAHELRNPLAPLRTGLELMRLAGNTAAPFDRIQGMMERQVEHMVRMIDDLLDVSRITSGRIHLQRKPTALADVIRSAAEANAAAIDAAGISLGVTLPDEPCVLDVDATRVVQVLTNLLHNATKFTPRQGRITIAARVIRNAGAGTLQVSVSDTGEGIPRELLPHVFDLFTQGERVLRGPQAGLGIGLALSRRLIELHGGRIDAFSEGIGRGTTIVFELPILAPDVTTVDRPAQAARPAPIRRRVVVVDDNHDAADAMGMLIETLGGEARVAYDGDSGAREVSAYRPDLVFLDIGMPGLDGYETCRRIRAEAGGADPMIVALTGWGQDHDKQRAADAGFDTHLTKPADPRDIERCLAEARDRAAPKKG